MCTAVWLAPCVTLAGQFETGAPANGTPTTDPAGAFHPISNGALPSAESDQVSLDAVAGHPGNYDGKTLRRHVMLGAVKPVGSVSTVAATDSDTGARILPNPTAGFYFIVQNPVADRIRAKGKNDALITFTVTRVPIPGRESFVGAIMRIELLGPDGSVTETIDAK